MCNYYLDCKTTCTLKKAHHSCKSNEITLWESATEKKLYCPTCGSTRVEKVFNPCSFCPFARRPEVKREKIYLVIL